RLENGGEVRRERLAGVAVVALALPQQLHRRGRTEVPCLDSQIADDECVHEAPSHDEPSWTESSITPPVRTCGIVRGNAITEARMSSRCRLQDHALAGPAVHRHHQRAV